MKLNNKTGKGAKNAAILGAAVVGTAVVAAGVKVLSDKKNRAIVKNAVKAVKKEVEVSVKKAGAELKIAKKKVDALKPKVEVKKVVKAVEKVFTGKSVVQKPRTLLSAAKSPVKKAVKKSGVKK